MPLYSFCCKECSLQFEEQLSVADRDLPLNGECKRCGGDLYRVPGCAGFRLLGYCWSRDNYTTTVGDDPRGHFQKEEDYD